MDNSEKGGSLKNIHAHYDISNDLFRTFLDKETLMYSSAIYDAVAQPPALMGQPSPGLRFKGTLEEAQWRKLDTLCDRAQILPGQTLLDIGFGWGGLSIHAAKKYGCKVTGITLSVEQKALAEERVEKEGLGHLINFEVVDYRIFARRQDNQGKFDRVISCEMIEAVGHEHLGEFFWAVEQVLKYDGVLVMDVRSKLHTLVLLAIQALIKITMCLLLALLLLYPTGNHYARGKIRDLLAVYRLYQHHYLPWKPLPFPPCSC